MKTNNLKVNVNWTTLSKATTIGSDYKNYSSNTKEEKNNLNACKGRKRTRFLMDSENNSEDSNESWSIAIAVGGLVRKRLKTSFYPGRAPFLHTIFKDASDSNGDAKWNIMLAKASTASYLVFDNSSIEFTIRCTKMEAQMVGLEKK